MDISARAISLAERPRAGHLGHQYSHAPGRPNLHLVSSSRRPRQVGAHVLRRHQTSIVAKRLKLATEMMRTDAGLHADQARRYVGKACGYLATRPLLMQHDRAALIVAHDVERVLTDINADYGDCGIELLRHGVLLVFGAHGQLKTLAGQEHGRTIPLAALPRGLYVATGLKRLVGLFCCSLCLPPVRPQFRQCFAMPYSRSP